MANTEQNKSFIIYLKDLFDKNFIIPIYQRNYDWDFTLVKQLIDDIIDFCKNNRNNNYSLGVMQVYNRSKDTNNCLYEVVDGQQRLTTLYLLFCALRDYEKKCNEKQCSEWAKFLEHSPQFECRNKVKATLEALKNGVSYEHSLSDNKIKFTYRCITQYLEKRLKNNFSNFKYYLLNKTYMFISILPDDTDLNHYFEIMNNRGEQLEMHEILKARLLEKIKDDDKLSCLFSMIWDSCSDMDGYILKRIKIDINDCQLNKLNIDELKNKFYQFQFLN